MLGIGYHITPGDKLDLYVKAGVGYFFISSSTKWTPKTPSNSSSLAVNSAQASGLGYGGSAGLKYFFSKNFGIGISGGWPFYASGGLELRF